jgi:hypothetical protein
MNETTRTQLMVLVERAVRPVRASADRTTKMRKELLAHVSEVFEEEMTKLGDERAALEQTRLRFGNPRDLTSQLQDTVPWSDAVPRFLGEFMRLRPGEPVIRRAIRHALLMPLLLAVQIPIFVVPFLFIRDRWNHWPTQAVSLGVLLITSSVLAFLFTMAANGARRALFESTPRAWTKGILVAASSALFIPAVTFGVCLAVTGDATASLPDVSATVFFSPLMSLLLVIVAKLTADEMRFNQEWASLPIDA